MHTRTCMQSIASLFQLRFHESWRDLSFLNVNLREALQDHFPSDADRSGSIVSVTLLPTFIMKMYYKSCFLFEQNLAQVSLIGNRFLSEAKHTRDFASSRIKFLPVQSRGRVVLSSRQLQRSPVSYIIENHQCFNFSQIHIIISEQIGRTLSH